MILNDFYQVIDEELNGILEKYKEDQLLIRHKNSISNQKSYALLIWFLDFYARKSNYKDYITDGKEDSSCDIIFDNVDDLGKRMFYIVQSKWNNARNSNKETDKDEVLKALSDFDTILQGERKTVNDRLKIKLEELDRHLKNMDLLYFLKTLEIPY